MEHCSEGVGAGAEFYRALETAARKRHGGLGGWGFPGKLAVPIS